MTSNASSFESELRHHIEGDVHFDSIHKSVYSVDASIYEIEPVGIVVPKHKQDILNAIRIANSYQVPIIPRGAATGITGGCIGKGLILDTSKYLNQILEINCNDKIAICQPGVVQDRLNESLSSYGYRLGPDTSTGNRATLGGMVSNNAAGAHSLLFGTMAEHIEAIELILPNGEILEFYSLNEEELSEKLALQNSEGHIYREVIRIQKEYKNDIEQHFPKIPRRVSGYNLDALLMPGPLNMCRLIAGSEGTFGVITKITVALSPKLRTVGLCVVHFHDMIQGMRCIEKMLTFKPIALEMIDDKIIAMGRISPSMRDKLEWLVESPQAIFVAEFEGDNFDDVNRQILTFENEMKAQGIGYAHITILDPQKMNYVWDLRKSGLGLLLSKRTYSRAIAFLEDLTLPPNRLADFISQFVTMLKANGKEAGIYGHVGSGCMHIRPYIDMRQEEELHLMEKLMLNTADLVLEFGGALSGEHGDGFIRSWLNKKMFGARIYQAFIELKAAFDPDNRMNPGKIVHGLPLLHDLRSDPNSKPAPIHTFLDFSEEGGFHLAADLCNGNGLCRKAEKTMCPSFQATGDEYDTTRARAQALRAIINGRRPIEEFSGKGLYDVLDLCLECKGCKTECPSQVDMAKMKAEVLYHYQKKHGISWRSWLFGNIGKIYAMSSCFPTVANWLNDTRLSKMVFSWLGITQERPFPHFAKQPFSHWFAHFKPKIQHHKKVVLFNDTFTEFNEPDIGIAAVKILDALGYAVIVPKWRCCGRPAISKGLLEEAKRKAIDLTEVLMPFAREGIPIIGLEPSCLLAIKDDFKGLLGADDSKQLSKQCVTFDEFLEKHLTNGKLPLPLTEKQQKVLVHGHCHQKALIGTRPTLAVLKAIPGIEVSEINSGCCGLAGSFGYEQEHYELSMKIGDLRLFPAIELAEKDTLLVADGFSCRCQIAHGTHRKAMHLAEFLWYRLPTSMY